jgi:hypothetical protein
MLTEDPLHSDFLALKPGDWIEFLTPTFLRRGEVLTRKGRSLLVHYDGFDGPTGIPDAEMYFSSPREGQYVMRRIPHRKRVAAPADESSMTVRQAAARLGTDAKGIRRMLRAGQLEGRMEDGRWVAVSGSGVR